MANKLSEQVIQNLQELAEHIAKSQRLNNDAKEELYTHLEDKALEYLNDNAQLSEADMLLLVREHFGNPEYLNRIFSAGRSQKKPGILADIMQADLWSQDRDVFWGVTLFPWKPKNRILYAVYLFFFVEILGGVIMLITTIVGNRIPPWEWILFPALALFLAGIFYRLYFNIGQRLDKKRQYLRQSADLQDDGLIIHGALQSPGIIQYVDHQLILTPLVGEQLVIPISSITKVSELRSCMQVYFGNNRFFKLELIGDSGRIGFGIGHPEKWRKILPV
ncbi:MAG: hypothetical protein ACE14V_02315 [bacterium]